MNDNEWNTDKGKSSSKERRRKVMVWITELGMVGGCVAVFFFFLVTLIGVYFPQGSTLVGERNDELFGDLNDADGVDLQIDSQASAQDAYAAKIVRMQRRVQRRGGLLIRNVVWAAAFGFVLLNSLLVSTQQDADQVALCGALTVIVTASYIFSIRRHIGASIEARQWRELFNGLA